MLKSLLVLSCAVGAALSVPVESDETVPRPGEFCGYESCPQTEAGVLNVHIVPHTHDDVGWLKTVDQYYYGSRNNIQKAGVQYILDSVIKELWADPKRKFIYVETAFFWKWWVRQTDDVRHKVHTLVRQGRLQFVGGAWSMNDEAATHYQSTIDQFTWGLSKLNQTFGHCALPRVGWQIDPFGHAREFASLLSGMGYDGLFLGRIDYQDKRARLQDKHMEMLWRGDDDLGPPSDIFTGVLYNTYSPPPGFCFDVLCSDEPIIDDPDSPMYNVEERISKFLSYVQKQSNSYATNNVVVTMGGDFTYQDAAMWYTNLDKLIEYTNVKAAKDHLNVKLFYSTPNCYLKAVKDANPTLPTKQDDFFPYASDPNAYWTGYFTSRPTTKYFEREGNNYLQALKQLQVLAGLEEHNMFVLNELKSAMGVMQHHDAVTGTEKEHVTHDYERLLDQAIEDALLVARQAFNKQTQSDPLKPPILSFDRCHFNESRCHTSENSEQFVVTVYNPLAWSVDAVPVRIPVVEDQYAVVAPNGEEIVSQIIELPEQVTKIPTRDSKATHEIVFLAYNVPGMGYKAFYVKRKSKMAKRDVPYSADTTTDVFNDKKSIYHMNMNDYWRDEREQPIVEIRNIEENETNKANQAQNNEETTLKEPKLLFTKLKVPAGDEATNMPFIRKTHSTNDKNCDCVKNINMDMLRDEKKTNTARNMEDLELLLSEARRQLQDIAERVPIRDDVSRTVQYPSLNDDEMRMLADDPMVVERYPDDVFLENEHLKLRINNTTGQITHIIYANGTESPFSIKMLYYPGCVGDNTEFTKRSSGAYIFRPNATRPYELEQNYSKVIKGNVVDEYHYANSGYTSGVVRVYKHASLNYVENEWLVGPIPIDDDVGKEIVVRYVTDVVNNGEFYTDSNGRQMLKRKLNKRPQWNANLEEPIAGNYYPITNRIYIENGKRISVLIDRSEGGASIEEGTVELMLHRRLLHDDAFGVGEALNETAKGLGLVVRGKHKIIISNVNDKQAAIDEKKKILESHLQPLVFVSDAKALALTDWLTLKNKIGGIKTSVPKGVHILTLEPFEEGTILIRLENYLEKSDLTDTNVEIDLRGIFNDIKFKSYKETTLSANQWLSDYHKWTWNKDEQFKDNFNDAYGNYEGVNVAADGVASAPDDGFKIVLKAKQIRTFVVKYEL